MRISRRQLIKIINENLLSESMLMIAAGVGAYAVAGYVFGKTYKMSAANRDENEIYTSLALELKNNLNRYEEMFNDLIAHANECNDQGLLREISHYYIAGKKLGEIIGLDWDMSDTFSMIGDLATSSGGGLASAGSGINISKDVIKGGSSTARSLIGPILGIFFAGYDVYDTEKIADEVRREVDIDRMSDDLEGFLRIHDQYKAGTLKCLPAQQK